MTANPNQPAIAVTGLRKSYGDKLVLDGIDLTVAEGTIFSLLGPNGAGKTTVVHILSTLTRTDGGEIRVAGHDPIRELTSASRWSPAVHSTAGCSCSSMCPPSSLVRRTAITPRHEPRHEYAACWQQGSGVSPI